MKQYVWKIFLNPEKEERWLNQMAHRGFGLKRRFGIRYEFEEILPGEYIYKIQLLEQRPELLEFNKYLMALDYMNISCIIIWYNRLYLRKSAMDAPNKIDLGKASELIFYKRVHRFCRELILIAGLTDLGMVMVNLFWSGFNSEFSVNLIVIGIAGVLTAVIGMADYFVVKVIKKLKCEETK